MAKKWIVSSSRNHPALPWNVRGEESLRRWDYMITGSVRSNDFEKYLNSYGADGWQLVSVLSVDHLVIYDEPPEGAEVNDPVIDDKPPEAGWLFFWKREIT